MAVAQHHDAVRYVYVLFETLNQVINFSGTEKQHVADDYAKWLHVGQVECEVSL